MAAYANDGSKITEYVITAYLLSDAVTYKISEKALTTTDFIIPSGIPAY